MHILRVATVYDPDVDALPAEFRNVLTGQDVQAIQTGPEFFATLARADSPKWLRKILSCCAESGLGARRLAQMAPQNTIMLRRERIRATILLRRRYTVPSLLPL